jgi:hypothetical protein
VMDPETITIATFTLETFDVAVPVPGFVTCTGTTATFNSTIPLLPNTKYMAKLTKDVADLAGNKIGISDIEWTFTTD